MCFKKTVNVYSGGTSVNVENQAPPFSIYIALQKYKSLKRLIYAPDYDLENAEFWAREYKLIHDFLCMANDCCQELLPPIEVFKEMVKRKDRDKMTDCLIKIHYCIYLIEKELISK